MKQPLDFNTDDKRQEATINSGISSDVYMAALDEARYGERQHFEAFQLEQLHHKTMYAPVTIIKPQS